MSEPVAVNESPLPESKTALARALRIGRSFTELTAMVTVAIEDSADPSLTLN